MADLNQLISLLGEISDSDKALVEKAYHFAEKAHGEQKRFSGEPYFNHCFETAKILAEQGMGPVSAAAGLLHDTLEDANIKPEELEKEFGKEVLFLVDGVTKLGKLRYHGVERHIESLRKLFVAMSQDLRVLIIKLADRLHNMRTLQYVKPEKQARIATETLQIYAPLAYRLSMRKINRELENLAFPYVFPKENKIVKGLLKQREKENAARLEKFSRSIRQELAKNNLTNIHADTRVKSTYSLWRKLQRKNMEIENVYDILALRVIVPSLEDCYKVLGIIHSHWRPLPGRIKDYIAFPKPNNYQGVHTTVFTGDGGIVEVQIRTEEMHRQAEYGVASHLSFKEVKKAGEKTLGLLWLAQFIPFIGKKKDDTVEKNKEVPNWIKQIADSQTELLKSGDDEYFDNMQTDFFQHRVFVFTPKGDVVDLPIKAGPIDFAFAIHSDIGEHTSGARVNGKLVSLDTKLKNGDIVEILVKENSHPNAKWLDFVKTNFAKKKIRESVDKIGKR
ncbi:MAG: RelA/SpoT family protein [Candidatus Paceibacterota bacterium]|jgi:GTP pyrophosphokinase